MLKRIRTRGIVCLLLAALTILVCFAGCAGSAESGGTTEGDLSRFENARLGVVTGSLYGGYSRELFPNASISEFNNFADVLGALIQGKVDGTMLDRPNFNSVKRTESGLSCMATDYSVEIGFGFQKNGEGDALKAQMDTFLARLKANADDNLLPYVLQFPESGVLFKQIKPNAEEHGKQSCDDKQKNGHSLDLPTV